MINIFGSDSIEEVPSALVEMERRGRKRNLEHVFRYHTGTREHATGSRRREDEPRPTVREIAIPGF